MTELAKDIIQRVERLATALSFTPERAKGYAARLRRVFASRLRRKRLKDAFQSLNANGLVVQLDSFGGHFELPLANNMTCRLIVGGYEAMQQLLLKSLLQPGDHMVDVGANLGLFTVLAGTIVGPTGHVLAVEPVPRILEHLQRNVHRNHLRNVTIFEGVATDRSQLCEIHTSEGAEEYSSLNKIAHPDAQRNKHDTLEVQGLPIDELVSKYRLEPRVLKVDTEGAEGLVFTGALATLRAYRPILLSELDDRLLKGFGWSSGKVIQLLNDAGYVVIDQHSKRAISASSADFVGDVIGIPEEARQVITV